METGIKGVFRRRYHLAFLMVFFLISFINKITFINHPFFGLGKSLNYQYDYKFQPLQANTCIDGSLSACRVTTTFGGHFITFPLIVSYINKLIGYSPYTIFGLNFVLSFLIILMVDQLTRLIYPDSFYRPFLPLLVLVTTPFINLFNTSGLAETFSSLSLLAFLFFFFKALDDKFSPKSGFFWSSLFYLILSILIKRENMLLVGAAPIVILLMIAKKEFNKNMLKRVSIYFALTLIVLFALTFLINFFQIEKQEGAMIASQTFSIANLVRILPLFWSSYFNFQLFGLTGVLVLIATWFVLFKPSDTRFNVIFILCVFYILLYSSHYRSYYQIKFGDLTVFETLRYSTNYFPLLCICLSAIPINQLTGKMKFTVGTCGLIYVTCAFFLSMNLRTKYSEDEYSQRIFPVKKTLALISENDVIVTDIPLIFHLFANDHQIIVDAYSTSIERIQ